MFDSVISVHSLCLCLLSFFEHVYHHTSVLLHDAVVITASVVSCVTLSLPPGQPVPTWSWGRAYLSASSVLLLCCSSSSSPCRALLSSSPPWLSLSVHTVRSLSTIPSCLSWTTSHQPVPVLFSSFLSDLLLLLLFFCSSILRRVFPAWRARISCVIHASSSTGRSFRYTARSGADPSLSKNRSAWL